MKTNVVLNKFNVNAGYPDKYRTVIYSSTAWHKVIVENVQGLERDFVLKTFMNAVHPLDFIPVSYEVCPDHSSFLLKNCGAAIESLCRHNMLVPNPNNKEKPFIVSIELCFASAADLKVNVQSNVICVIQKRLSADGVLNLEQFYKDPSLNEFCPLSQPKLMFFILHLSKGFNIKFLRLGNNQIEILKPLEAIYGLKSLVAIDLRNNNISSASELLALKELSVSELWLDGNPVCAEYDEFSYGRAMQEILSGLVKLDGFKIMRKGAFMPFRRNFLCATDGQDLVDQFLEHYFTIYDSPNRSALNPVYHRQALFSLTSRYLILQSTSSNAKLNSYNQFNRNIKQISDFSKNDLYLFKGQQSILKILNSLPRTEHDPYTFTVDLMTYTDTTAIVVVTGVFQEVYESDLNVGRQYGFMRTFVLLAGANNEYNIVNEQLHVSNATSIQALKAFKIPRPRKLHYIQIPTPQDHKERNEMIETMKIITGLNTEWSKNCLEDAQYNLKKALSTFTDLFKVDKIPRSAFASEILSEPAQQNSFQHDLQEQTLMTKFTNTEHKMINFDLVPVPSPVLPKKVLSEASTSSSFSKSAAQKMDSADDIFEMSYMNDDGISSISDISDSKREVIVYDDATTRPLEIKKKRLRKKPLTRATPANPNGKADSWKEKILDIRDKVNKFKAQLQAKNIAQACIIAEEIVNAHGADSLMPWQHILKGFYAISSELARQYVEKGRKLLPKTYGGSPSYITQQSPERRRRSENRDKTPIEPIIIHYKNEAKRYKPPLPGTVDNVKKLDFKNKILKFKTLLALDDYKNADALLEVLAKDHGSEVYLWRKILSFCYKQDLKTARQFITTIKTANPYCINGIVFNSVVAEQECRYGDSTLGRRTFEKLACQYSERILHHFVPYLHYLCDIKDFNYARNFLSRNIHKVEHQYNLLKLKKEIRTLEKVYDCELL